LGGEISFESRSGGGTIFRVVLLPDPSEAVEVQPPVASYACARRGRILIIDDEVMLGELVKRALGRDHEVVFFSNATQALERLGSGANFDVILCDLMMPVMTGAEFHERLVQLRPDHADRVVFFTGAAFSQGARDFLQRVPNLCLEKPVNIRALRSLISERVA
jgi:CheY-like chemotaxis protein